MTEPRPDTQAAPTCWWHPDRKTGLRCTRCERYACTDCLREASVGYQCIDCVATGRREDKAREVAHRRAGFGHRTVAGARHSRQLVVTPLLIAVNVLVFVVTVIQAQSLVDNEASQVFVGSSLLTPVMAAGEWWRLVTAGFLHFGPIHLLMNMLALYILGRELEPILGRARFVALYALSLVGGSAAVFAFADERAQTAGASGAVFGLLGAILIAAIRLKLDLTWILAMVGLNVAISFVPGVSLLGHAGGFITGALVMAALVYAPERNRMPVQVGTIVLVAAALAGFIIWRDAQFPADLACTYDISWFNCGVMPVGSG